MLNSLIYRINARKRRDSLIIGLVVAVCTFLLLLYAFHWVTDWVDILRPYYITCLWYS